MSSQDSIDTEDRVTELFGPQADEERDVAEHHDTARKELLDELEPMIEHYRHMDVQPPFSAGELIVIILLEAGQAGLAAAEIIQNIVLSFPYYTKKAVTEYALSAANRVDRVLRNGGFWWSDDPVPMVIEGFEEAISQHSVPIRTTSTSGNRIFTVDAAEARIFLSIHLTKPRQGTFNFLGLPAELRNTIYEYVFDWSGGKGLMVNSPNEKIVFKSSSRANGDCLNRSTSASGWEDNHALDEYCFTTPNLHKMLALSWTCKQVFKESVPYFFDQNTLRFSGFEDFADTVMSMPRPMLRELRHVIILKEAWSQNMEWRCRLAFRALARAEKLETFKMDTADSKWLGMSPGARQRLGRVTKFTHLKQIPGLGDLIVAASRAQTFELTGDCPQLKDYIETGAKELRALNAAKESEENIKKSNKAGRKRAAKNDQEDSQKVVKRRSRKAVTGADQ